MSIFFGGGGGGDSDTAKYVTCTHKLIKLLVRILGGFIQTKGVKRLLF